MQHSAANISSPKSARILRVLLTQPRRTWTLRELAQEAQVSLGMSHYAISSLIRMGFVNRGELNKIVVADPYRLIRQWAASHNYLFLNRFSEYYTFDIEFEAFVSRFKNLSNRITQRYAMTLHAAAWLVAPYVRPTDFHIYVDSSIDTRDFKTLLKITGVSPIERSGNVKFVTPYDKGVFYSSMIVDGVRIVSPVQLYVDLFNYPGRGQEAAEKLFEKIGKDWQTQIVRHK